MLALCTNREILEIDIKNLKTNSTEDESTDSDFMSNSLTDPTSPPDLQSIRQPAGTQSMFSSNLIIRRNVKDVRRLASHPTLPYCKFYNKLLFIII